MERYKSIKGITLVALVVTIIIMLILAGVTIQGLTGTGLFKNAKLAATKSKYASAAEKVALAVNASYDNTGSLNDEYLADNINQIDGYKGQKLTKSDIKYDLKIVVDGFEFTISSTGKITGNEDKQVATLPENTEKTTAGTEVKPVDAWGMQTARYIKTSDGTEVTTLQKVSTVYAISDGNNNTIPVPNGFYYVGGTKNSGVVISDNKADQNKYAGKEDVLAGVTYNSDGTVNTDSSELKGNQFVFIPCTESEYSKINWGKSNVNWESKTSTAELTQIQKYGGFYIGRYEAGTSNIQLSTNINFSAQNSASGWQNTDFSIRSGLNHSVTSGKVTEKAGEIPYYHADYYTSQILSKSMYSENNYVKSGLITGTMWDMAMNFIANGDNSVVTSSSWGNYNNGAVTYTAGQGRYAEVNSSNGAMTTAFKVSDGSYHYGIKTTAISENVKKKNMYDLAGNLWEWTEELAYDLSNNYYMLRGGSFYDSYSDTPACCRGYNTATHTSTSHGFRVALYIL